MIQMLFPSHLLNLLLVVDSRVHFLDHSSLDHSSSLMACAYSMFKIFNLNQSLDSRLKCPIAYYITSPMCSTNKHKCNKAKSEPTPKQSPPPAPAILPISFSNSLLQVFKPKAFKSYVTPLSLFHPTLWPSASQNTFKIHTEVHLFSSCSLRSFWSKPASYFAWFICNSFLTGLFTSDPIPHHQPQFVLPIIASVILLKCS